jgi:hypothetical protein
MPPLKSRLLDEVAIEPHVVGNHPQPTPDDHKEQPEREHTMPARSASPAVRE